MKTFDPFGGCGTVGVVSRLYGSDYELWDLNPIIETLHKVATMKPTEIDIGQVRQQMMASQSEFIPKWDGWAIGSLKSFCAFLYKAWGYYHNLPEGDLKLILTVPLLRTTRSFSYDDQGRLKLTKSAKSKKTHRKN